jgi:hypothetical protein
MKENIQHVCIYNEFQTQFSRNGAGVRQYQIFRNINAIPILQNYKYKIKNFCINVDAIVNKIGLDESSYISLPFRIYLENINVVQNRLNDDTFVSYRYNNILNNPDLSFKADYISDSSDQCSLASVFKNFLRQDKGNFDYLSTNLAKTNTVAEFPLITRSYDKVAANPPDLTISNLDEKDFFFDSKNYPYLAFTVFPFIQTLLANNNNVNLYFGYEVNFDLIQEL